MHGALCFAGTGPAQAQPKPAGLDWQAVGPLHIARAETTAGQLSRFVQATGRVTQAERAGGGQVFESGWTRKPGWQWQWQWRRPFGGAQDAADGELAVHVTFGEARAFCQ